LQIGTPDKHTRDNADSHWCLIRESSIACEDADGNKGKRSRASGVKEKEKERAGLTEEKRSDRKAPHTPCLHNVATQAKAKALLKACARSPFVLLPYSHSNPTHAWEGQRQAASKASEQMRETGGENK